MTQFPAQQQAPVTPRPHVGLGQALKNWAKYMFRFNGRASRSEFWWVILLWIILGIILGIVFSVLVGGSIVTIDQAHTDYLNGAITRSEYQDVVNSTAPVHTSLFIVFALFGLAQFVTTLGLYWRRLHDANFSGLFYLLTFIGLAIVPFIMCILPSKPEGVRFDKPDDANRP